MKLAVYVDLDAVFYQGCLTHLPLDKMAAI